MGSWLYDWGLFMSLAPSRGGQRRIERTVFFIEAG